MTDVGEGHLSLNGGDRDVSRNGGETGEGHLNMDVVEQPAADPLRDLLRADVISGDAADFTMGGGGGRLTESEGRGKQCGGVLKDLNLDLGMATKQIPSQAVASHFTPGRNSFTDISPFEKKSWHSKASLAPFFCRLCRQSRPIGTMFFGVFPVGGTRGQDWQQICAEPGWGTQDAVTRGPLPQCWAASPCGSTTTHL